MLQNGFSQQFPFQNHATFAKADLGQLGCINNKWAHVKYMYVLRYLHYQVNKKHKVEFLAKQFCDYDWSKKLVFDTKNMFLTEKHRQGCTSGKHTCHMRFSYCSADISMAKQAQNTLLLPFYSSMAKQAQNALLLPFYSLIL